MRALFLMVAAVFLGACNCGRPAVGPDNGNGGGGASGGGGGAGAACIAGAVSIAVTPADATVTVPSSGAGPVQLTATATMGDGSTADVTGQVSWTVTRDDDTPPGSIAAGSFTPHAGAGGSIQVTASDGCVSGTTRVTLQLEATFDDPGPAVTGRFGGTVVTGNAALAPAIVYPNTETRFPRNIYKVLFQWRANGNDYFRLNFEGPKAKVVVYSDGAFAQCAAASPPAGCYEADTQSWLAIAGSNAGEVVTLTVDGVRPNDTNVYRSAPIRLGFSKRDVKGALFYWSTTVAGIRRAAVSDAAPEGYIVAKPVATVLPSPGGTVKCVACHTVSRSGKKIVAFSDTTASKGIYVYDVTLTPPPTPVITTQITDKKGFGTFSPDDARVVATVGDKLAEFDANNGTKLADLPMAKGTNPDWSPTGKELVYSNQGGDSPGNASLEVIDYTNGQWGPTRLLVAAAGLTNLFPSYSPDGTHVAYSRGQGGHGDRTFQLFLAPSDGGTPVELVTANRHVNNLVTDGQFENNMPTWAPPGDLDWVAFNSLRPYGVVFPNGGTQQIWVAAIDRGKLGTGQDPSFPAFRFAFQNLNENNHRAYWTLDVRVPEDGGTLQEGGGDGGTTDAGTCLAEGAPCDQTSGPVCCGALVCDTAVDAGGFACKGLQVN
ncbi:MAG: TolB family protein [Myxococcota bacterium]